MTLHGVMHIFLNSEAARASLTCAAIGLLLLIAHDQMPKDFD